MAISEARKRANKKWNDANMSERYARITALIPKNRRETVEAYAKSHGESVSGLINRLLQAEIGMTQEEWRAGD